MVQYNSKTYNTNMIINKRISGWRKISLAITGVLMLALIICTGVYAFSGSLFGWNPFSNDSTQSTSGNNPPSEEQVNGGASIKEDSLKSGGASGSDQPVAPIVQEDGRQKVQLDITGVNRLGTVTRIGILISTLDQTGTCTLTVTSTAGVVLYSSSAGVQALSNTSTCKGFDIPNESLANTSYVIVVAFSSNDKYGTVSYEGS